MEQAADILEDGIEAAAQALDKIAESRPAISAEIAQLLGMTDVPQTRRMACAILANALIFHERIAGMYPGVSTLLKLSDTDSVKLQDVFLEAWTHILTINYYPIFAIAKDILSNFQAEDAPEILKRLLTAARQVNATGVDNAHDLTGRIFQRLIADRKYLATFYTLPASAALLARLAVAKLQDVDWSDSEALSKLRVGDFACGTGALLSAVYEQIAARHERAGGDVAKLHPVIMEEVLYGCDVMPSAVHITGSTLSGLQPNVDFRESHLYTMPYGRQVDGTVKIGSLELLQGSEVQTLFNTSDPALRTGSLGEETAAHVNVDIPDGGYDLVIMNPPFTRNVTREGATANAVAAAFAAFEATDVDQKEMANRLGDLKIGGCYHGNAGIASAFAALADKKLKPGGILALVLPLTVASGTAWLGFRRMLSESYENLSVLSIAANGRDMAFSSDTGMAECLVIAKKVGNLDKQIERTSFISLKSRPSGLGSANVAANNIASCDNIRKIDDGPYGGTSLTLGEDLIGEMLTTLQDALEESWSAVRLQDYTLAQVAYSLFRSQLWLPASPSGSALQTERLSNIGRLGTYHLDIIGPTPRGPFDKTLPSPTATYPALWNHDAKQETKIVCLPDSSLQVRLGMEAKANRVWESRSRAHLSLDFRYNSQPLMAAFTNQESLGGRAWPNVSFDNKRF